MSTQYMKLAPNALRFTYETWKNKTKSIKVLDLLMKNWKIRVWCSCTELTLHYPSEYRNFHPEFPFPNFEFWIVVLLCPWNNDSESLWVSMMSSSKLSAAPSCTTMYWNYFCRKIFHFYFYFILEFSQDCF